MDDYEMQQVSPALLEAMKIGKACELASMLMQGSVWTHKCERTLWLAVMEYLTFRGAEKVLDPAGYFEGSA